MINRVLILALINIFFISCSKKEESIYILPENFTGPVIILFGQPNGELEKYHNDKRLYIIPENGILKTQFEADYGFSEFPEFYYKKIDSTNRIKYKFDLNSLPVDSIVCYGGGAGTANKDPKGTKTINFTTYYIGNKEQIQKAIDSLDVFDFTKLEE